MKEKKVLWLLAVVGTMVLSSCKTNQSNSSSTISSSSTSSTSSESIVDSTSTSSSETDYKSKLEKALEKDYSNMTVDVVSVYDGGSQEEYYSEFYYNDFTIVYTPSVAELGYDPYTYFHDYNGLSYQYFEADRPNDPTSKAAWMNKGYDDTINYALEYIYFDMDLLLEEIDPTTAVYQSGMYIISDADVVANLNMTVFGSFFFNDIQYVAIYVDSDGYFQQIVGLQEIDNEDDFVQIKFGQFGTTTFNGELPEVPSEENIMEYWEYKGWDGPYVESYVESLTLTPKQDLVDNKLVMDIEDEVNATYTYAPEDANQAKDWRLHSTDETVARIEFDFDDADGNKQVKIVAVGAGEAEVYIRARGKDGIDTGVESNKILVHVNPLPEQNLEGIKYNLSFTGLSSDGTLGVLNAENNNLPVSATTNKASLNAGNSELFGNATTLMLNPGDNGTGSATVTFDFSDQQVSSISLYYGLYWADDKANSSYIQSLTIETTNDIAGGQWNVIDIKDEVLSNISSENFKLLEKSFEPASKVRISVTSNFIGRHFRFSFSEVAFMANDECHDHVDVVDVPVTGISISTPNNQTTLKCGKSLTISYVITPADATDKTLTWYTSDEEIATFENNVLTASATNIGTVEIYAKAVNGVESNRLTITIESIPEVDERLIGSWLGDDYVTRVKFDITSEETVVTIADDTYTLTYLDKEDNTYVFQDANGNYANISYDTENKIYVVAKLGEVYINRYTYNFDVYKYVPATSITLTSEKTTLDIGDSTSIAISFDPDNATGLGVNDEIIWTADVDGVVEFNDTTSGDTGLFVTAVGAGEVTITATNGEGVSNTITLVVKEPVKVASINIASETGSNEVKVNETLTLIAEVSGEDGQQPANSELTWTSSDSTIASVSKDGVVTGKVASEEMVTITATATDGSNVFATFEVKVLASETNELPSGLVGTWSGMDGNGISINFVIEADGSLSLELVDYGDSFAFELVSVDGNVYTFENADNALTLVINFDATYPEDTTFELNEGEYVTDYFICVTAWDSFEKIA